MGDENDTGKAKPDAKKEAEAPEVPPWLPLPKDFADFLECKSDSISLAGDGLKTGVEGVTAGFSQAKKKGHFKVTIKGLKDKVPIELPDPLELDASVDKDGKLHIHVRDRKDIPQPIKDGIRDFVNKWNRFVNGKGSKLGPPETKDGKLVLAKVKTTAALPDGKGFLPHVPLGEKVAAGALVLASVGFGVGFMNAGDETKTVSAPGGKAAPVGDKTSFLEPVAMVTVTPPGRPPVAADFSVSAGILEVNAPLFVMEPHIFRLLNKADNPLDSLTLEVPRNEGTVTGSTDRGGTFSCRVSHRGGPGGSPSGAECTVRPPSEPLVPPASAGPGTTDETARTTEETEGKPWSLLAIPGALLGAAGGLLLDEERRRRANGGNGDDGNGGNGGDGDDQFPIEEIGDKVEQTPPVAVSTKDPPCECSGYLVIGGRSTLRICECLKLDWELDESDNRRPIVRGRFPDNGDVFCARQYSIERVIAECTGGGSIPNAESPLLNRAGIKWQAKKGPGADELTLSCQAKAWVWCPGKDPYEQEFAGELTIKLEKVKCQVSIIINEDKYWKGETGHTGLRIRCGEYDTIFGYFPSGMSDLHAVSGVSGDSKVVQWSSCDDTQADGVSGYYKDITRREFTFSAACRDCERLRGRWSDLFKNPGKFDLYDNNCTTAAVELVSGIVKLPDKLAEDFFGWGAKSPATLKELLEKGGLKPVVHPAGSPFAPKDH